MLYCYLIIVLIMNILMTNALGENIPPYPNHLRQLRERSMISRAILVTRCKKLAEQDDTRYVGLTVSTVRLLELGLTRPRRTTAATLSVALETSVEELFPLGTDDPTRNPDGRTGAAVARPRGRPRNP